MTGFIGLMDDHRSSIGSVISDVRAVIRFTTPSIISICFPRISAYSCGDSVIIIFCSLMLLS